MNADGLAQGMLFVMVIFVSFLPKFLIRKALSNEGALQNYIFWFVQKCLRLQFELFILLCNNSDDDFGCKVMEISWTVWFYYVGRRGTTETSNTRMDID